MDCKSYLHNLIMVPYMKKFADTRSRKSKDRLYNGRKKKRHNDSHLQNCKQKTKDLAPRTALKTGVNSRRGE